MTRDLDPTPGRTPARGAARSGRPQLREEIRQALLKSDSEHYLQIADSVRDLEDESFADLIVDVGLAEIDRDLEELRAIEAALLRVADGSYGSVRGLRQADRRASGSRSRRTPCAASTARRSSSARTSRRPATRCRK